jgi:hypothetical protein
VGKRSVSSAGSVNGMHPVVCFGALTSSHDNRPSKPSVGLKTTSLGSDSEKKFSQLEPPRKFIRASGSFLNHHPATRISGSIDDLLLKNRMVSKSTESS